jgi:hypothetical protein
VVVELNGGGRIGGIGTSKPPSSLERASSFSRRQSPASFQVFRPAHSARPTEAASGFGCNTATKCSTAGRWAGFTTRASATTDRPAAIHDYHRFNVDPRRFRLLAVAFLRMALLPDPLVPHVFDVVEGFANGVVPRADFRAARKRVRQAEKDQHPHAGLLGRYGGVTDDAMEGRSVAVERVRRKYPAGGKATECGLIRCNFGNPYRPRAFDPKWLTPTAVALATGVYTERAFDRMPVLADALEEAGCDAAEILQHCRGLSRTPAVAG